MEAKDWDLILPYLKENERLFGISIEQDLLSVEGEMKDPLAVYRKVRPHQIAEVKKDGLEEYGESE
jgi:hypothetical protein